jgi:hypothetical protein
MRDSDMDLNPIDPNWQSVAPGTPVLTKDGQRLGTVKDRQQDGLLVAGDDGQGTDYLVTAADVGGISQDGVHLIVSGSEAMRAHWQGTSPSDAAAPGGMAPGAMTRERTAASTEEQPS